jgi:hypothetical protein
MLEIRETTTGVKKEVRVYVIGLVTDLNSEFSPGVIQFRRRPGAY